MIKDMTEIDVITNIQEISKILDKCCLGYFTGTNKQYVIESIKANCRLLHMLNLALDGE